MYGPNNAVPEPNAPQTGPALDRKMTVFLLPDSDKRCLLVTTAQLIAIVDLLEVELKVLTA